MASTVGSSSRRVGHRQQRRAVDEHDVGVAGGRSEDAVRLSEQLGGLTEQADQANVGDRSGLRHGRDVVTRHAVERDDRRRIVGQAEGSVQLGAAGVEVDAHHGLAGASERGGEARDGGRLAFPRAGRGDEHHARGPLARHADDRQQPNAGAEASIGLGRCRGRPGDRFDLAASLLRPVEHRDLGEHWELDCFLGLFLRTESGVKAFEQDRQRRAKQQTEDDAEQHAAGAGGRRLEPAAVDRDGHGLFKREQPRAVGAARGDVLELLVGAAVRADQCVALRSEQSSVTLAGAVDATVEVADLGLELVEALAERVELQPLALLLALVEVPHRLGREQVGEPYRANESASSAVMLMVPTSLSTLVWMLDAMTGPGVLESSSSATRLGTSPTRTSRLAVARSTVRCTPGDVSRISVCVARNVRTVGPVPA